MRWQLFLGQTNDPPTGDSGYLVVLDSAPPTKTNSYFDVAPMTDGVIATGLDTYFEPGPQNSYNVLPSKVTQTSLDYFDPVSKSESAYDTLTPNTAPFISTLPLRLPTSEFTENFGYAPLTEGDYSTTASTTSGVRELGQSGVRSSRMMAPPPAVKSTHPPVAKAPAASQYTTAEHKF